MDTGGVMYAALRCRFAIHSRMSANGVVVATDLLNGGDAHAVSAAGRPYLDFVSDAVADQGLAHRRLIAHAAGLRVGLGRADDAIPLPVRNVLRATKGVPHRDHAVLGLLLGHDVG